jgi:hypothetical protein
MSIGVRCQECGTAYEVAYHLAGSRLQCRECAAIIDVPADAAKVKACTVCQKVLSDIDQARDSSGKYYCLSCFEGLEAALGALPAAAQVETRLIIEVGDEEEIVLQRQSDLGMFMTWLSKFRLPCLAIVLIVLLTPTTLILTYFFTKIGVILGAMLGVAGSWLLGICIVWVYILPFRDGPEEGFRCLWNRYQRGLWFQKSFPGTVRRPGRMAIVALIMIALATAYFYVVSLGNQRQPAESEPPAAMKHK